MDDLNRLGAEGVKFNVSSLQLEGKALVMDASDDSHDHHSLKRIGVPIVSKITYRWIRQ